MVGSVVGALVFGVGAKVTVGSRVGIRLALGFALDDGCSVGKGVGGCERAGVGSFVGTFRQKKNREGLDG